MRSIEDLTDQVRTRAGRLQFDEAMRAYNAGAYRSATIALWIAVIHDLTGKIRALAESGDKAALEQIKQVDTAREADDVRKMQSFENSLLEHACNDFELVTPREAAELRRLNTDRNVCAHPSFHDDLEAYDMSPEQVRAYACLVVDAVLSQPAVVGKALVDRFRTDTQSDSWPDEGLTEFLRSRYYSRARRSVMRNVLAIATKGAIRPPDGDDRVRARCAATLKAFADIDEGLVEATIADVLSNWRDHLTEDELIRVIGAVGGTTVTWRTLGHDNIALAGKLLRTRDVDDLIREGAFCSGTPASDDLHDHYAWAIRRLDGERLQDMVRQPFPRHQWVEGVLREVARANTWRGGERAMRMVVTLADELSLEELTEIGDHFLSNNQIHEAFNMPQLIATLVEATAAVPGARQMWRDVMAKHAESDDSETDPTKVHDYQAVRQLLDA